MERAYRRILRENHYFETPRLILRPHTMDDVEPVYEMSTDKDTLKYLIWPGIKTMEEAKITIGRHFPSSPGMFAIEIKETGEYFGNINLEVIPKHEKASLGYMCRRAFWGNGYMTEAAQQVVSLAFEILKVNRVEASYFKGNDASGSILKKAGLLYEGSAIDGIKVRGKFYTQLFYGVTRTQWLKEREHE